MSMMTGRWKAMKIVGSRMQDRRSRMVTSLGRFRRDRSGLAAVEFVMILPMMLLLFLGMVEVFDAVALKRKVTITASTLSDLISRAPSVDDPDFTNSFAAGGAILSPYPSTPLKATISQIYVDDKKVARVVWSKGWAKGGPTTGRATGIVDIPEDLKRVNRYLIWGEVEYLYTPTVPYLLGQGITLSERQFFEPRFSDCVLYKTKTCPKS